MDIAELIEKIRSKDDGIRSAAWQGAGDAGAGAIGPLAKVMAEGEMEVSRAAKRALWKIVRRSGRPGAEGEKSKALKALRGLLGESLPEAALREILWMISEISSGGPEVADLAALLSRAEIREDARMVLERIPGEASLQALKSALQTAPEEFKVNLAQSLRARGADAPGIPCVKLVPRKATGVKPGGS